MGAPLASLRISPPEGLGVWPLTPASSRALPLTKAACPLAWVRMTGLLGETLSSEACSGKPSTLGWAGRSTWTGASRGRRSTRRAWPV